MNERTIRQCYDVFKDNSKLTEIRILDSRKMFSGYFTDVETLLQEIKPYDNYNIYFTLNAINPSCYDREQKDKIIQKPKSTTSDNEIIAIDWIMVDIDVEKPSDTNSTDEEKELCKPIVNAIFKYLRDEGFSEPVICDSGNGYHINYRVAMLNNEENTLMRKNFLNALSMMFSSDKVKVDCSTFNASRICKTYGVISRKGSSSSIDRPQRESSIVRVPKEIKITSNELIKKVADIIPKPETPDKYNNYSTEKFDIDSFISKHNIRIRNIANFSGGRKYILDNCPFDNNHKAPDSALFVMDSGAIGFKCLHNSDSNKGWREFRSYYEPDAYDRKYNSFRFKPTFNRDVPTQFVPQKKDEEKGNIWIKLGDVEKPKLNPNDFIPTGIVEFDKKALGLMRKHITVLSGLRSSGKTSLLNMITLNAIKHKYKVGMWSGEMDAGEIKQWMYLQAAGKQYVKKRGNSEFYETNSMVDTKISNWLDPYFSLYSNEYSQDTNQLAASIEKRFEEEKFDLICLDNLMCLGDESLQGTINEKDKQKILIISRLAKKLNVHIILVAHPNKSSGLLRLSYISGTGDITNLAQNVFLWHRSKYNEHEHIREFERDYEELFGKGSFDRVRDFSNILEIAKFRAKGTVMGSTYGMYYEKESGRFLNTPTEHIVYGWQETPVVQEIQFENSFSSSVNSFETNTDFENDFMSNDVDEDFPL